MKIRAEFTKRRTRLLRALGNNGIAIVFAAKEVIRNGEVYYTYRQDSDFYYLTGFVEPNAIALFIPDRKEGEYVVFNRPVNEEIEMWTGKMAGQKGAVKDYGADQSFSIDEADKIIPDLIKGHEKIYFNLEMGEEVREQVFLWVEHIKNRARDGVNIPDSFVKLGSIAHELRLIKDSWEVELIRKVAEISAAAHLRAMKFCREGMTEQNLYAEIEYEFMRQGCTASAFQTMVGSGASTCVLHHPPETDKLKNGDLVLVDAGGEFNHYASDITRTFPVNGKFTKEQRIIYEAVLDVQLRLIEKVKPGVIWEDLNTLSKKLITEKLQEIGLLRGNLHELIAKEAFKPFYMHHFGHWVGLDDHDVGKYKVGNKWRELEPNMVLTVEPGIYISERIPNLDKKWYNIGVRIEDVVLVTKNGCEILTSGVPKTVSEIEDVFKNR